MCLSPKLNIVITLLGDLCSFPHNKAPLARKKKGQVRESTPRIKTGENDPHRAAATSHTDA